MACLLLASIHASGFGPFLRYQSIVLIDRLRRLHRHPHPRLQAGLQSEARSARCFQTAWHAMVVAAGNQGSSWGAWSALVAGGETPPATSTTAPGRERHAPH